MIRIAGPFFSQALFSLLVSPVFFVVSFTAHAIVSMESIHLGKPPEGFAGSFELGLAVESGNTETSGATSGIKLQWTRANNIDFILANYAYGENAGIRNKNKGFAHYRHIHSLDDRIAWEGFAQVSTDEFTHLTLRALVGGGVRVRPGEVSENRAIFLGLGVFYEAEVLDSAYADEADTETTFRGNSYLVCKYQFNAHVSFVSTTYYQPGLGDFSDYRAIEDFSLVSKLSDVSSLQVGLDIAHDSAPARDTDKTDTSIKLGFVVNF